MLDWFSWYWPVVMSPSVFTLFIVLWPLSRVLVLLQFCQLTVVCHLDLSAKVTDERWQLSFGCFCTSAVMFRCKPINFRGLVYKVLSYLKCKADTIFIIYICLSSSVSSAFINVDQYRTWDLKHAMLCCVCVCVSSSPSHSCHTLLASSPYLCWIVCFKLFQSISHFCKLNMKNYVHSSMRPTRLLIIIKWTYVYCTFILFYC
jgi:hypothetical protein